jgi:hypothetical protein
MAPKPKPKPARFVFAVGMVLAMALTILAVMAIWLRRARHRFTTLNFCFCTKAVDQLFAADPGRPPPMARSAFCNQLDFVSLYRGGL